MINNYSNEIIYENHKSKIRVLEVLLSLACIFSIFSQIPQTTIADITRFLSFPVWLLSLCFALFSFGSKINMKGIFYLSPLLIFDVLISIFQIFTGKNYLRSQLIYPLHLSAFIFLVTYISGQFISEKSLKNIINSYIISVTVVSAHIFFTSFIGKSWFTSTTYIYASKNSFAQNVLFASILVFIYGFLGSKKIKYPIILLLIFFLFILKCRSTLVGLILAIFYVIFFHIKNNLAKCWAILLLFVAIASIFLIPSLNDFFINEMLFNDRMDMGLNAASSGRITHFKVFVKHFEISPIIGNGRVRVESFPLSALAGFGITASPFILIFAIMPLFTSIKDLIKKQHSSLLTILVLFSIIALSNCLFEEQAPFGPGTKCFYLWFIYGMYLGRKDRIYFIDDYPIY